MSNYGDLPERLPVTVRLLTNQTFWEMVRELRRTAEGFQHTHFRMEMSAELMINRTVYDPEEM